MFKFEQNTIGMGTYVQETGYMKAYVAGYMKAYEKGYDEIHREYYAEGYMKACVNDYSESFAESYAELYVDGCERAAKKGYDRYYRESFAEGFVEGYAQGYTETAAKIINKSLREGIPLEEISEYLVLDSGFERFCLAEVLEIHASEYKTIETNDRLLDQAYL